MKGAKTAVDWLRFRHQGSPGEALEAMRGLFGDVGRWLNAERVPRGRDGFAEGANLRVADQVIGRLDWGGDSQRGWCRVNVFGEGCGMVSDWDAVEAVEALPSAELRRCDVALTTWRREVTHERVVHAHAAGLFATGGRPPSLQQVISSDPDAGRTCYVGKRTADKFFRGYEKGLELLGKYGLAIGPGAAIDGYPVHDIYRCEVELKAENTELPWEVIERRDQYFTGCYPFLAQLLPDVDSDILMRRPERLPRLELAQVLANVRQQYGASLFTALVAYEGDILRVWDQIVGKQHNEALLAAGVLNFEHA